MPRICDSYSSPIDYCLVCMPTEGEAAQRHKRPVPDSANDGRGCCFFYDADHPYYEGEGYTCVKCGVALTDTNA